jgi:hypothetical protein
LPKYLQQQQQQQGIAIRTGNVAKRAALHHYPNLAKVPAAAAAVHNDNSCKHWKKELDFIFCQKRVDFLQSFLSH